MFHDLHVLSSVGCHGHGEKRSLGVCDLDVLAQKYNASCYPSHGLGGQKILETVEGYVSDTCNRAQCPAGQDGEEPSLKGCGCPGMALDSSSI